MSNAMNEPKSTRAEQGKSRQPTASIGWRLSKPKLGKSQIYFIRAELYFLIAKFLKNGPCRQAARVSCHSSCCSGRFDGLIVFVLLRQALAEELASHKVRSRSPPAKFLSFRAGNVEINSAVGCVVE